MDKHKFEYGPLARGTFIALVALSTLVPLISWRYTGYYLAFLIFLAVGLRPLLESSGIYDLYQQLTIAARSKLDKGFLERRSAEIERKARDRKYQQWRRKDPRLPKDW